MSEKKWAHVPGPGRLLKWRKGARLTQQEAADLIGTDLASYNAFENGRERPGLDIAVAIDEVSEGRIEPKHWTEPSKRDVKAKAAS